jgi:pimeloyl-ACP methyl ester carboxylesterase
VLVHGAWHGGWCWDRVASRLRSKGHRVFCPTLTGLGERAHLLAPDVNMSTHVADVLGVLEAEELDDVILVGHSYAGMVISGVAAKAKARIRQLVYLDAAVIEDGEAWSTAHTPEVQAERRRLAKENGGLALPVPKAEVFGVAKPEDIAWVQRRLTPHPFAPYDEVMRWGVPPGNGLPKVYVDCTAPVYTGLNPVKQRYRGKPGWPFVELAAGHDAMVSAPAETAELLLKYA